MTEALTRADFLNDVIRVTNQDYEAVRRIKASDAALRKQLVDVAEIVKEECEQHNNFTREAAKWKEQVTALRAERDALKVVLTDLQKKWHYMATCDPDIDLVDAVADLSRQVAASEQAVKVAREALGDLLREAVILSEDYLSAFHDKPLDATIQGWDKARWLRALAASKKAKAVLKEPS